jgi:hypothetical protein
MALASYLSNFARNARPPRVTSRRSQPTTASSVRVAGRVNQPTTRATPRPIAWHDPLHGARPAAVTGPPLPTLAPAAPAVPAPTTFANVNPAGLPVDPAYEGQVAALARNRDDTLLSLAGQRTQGLQDYGFTQAPTGAVAFDPSNPFSRAALLRKNYQESKQGTQTGMAARGQLYAGALQTAQAANDTGFNQNENSLERALIGFLTNNQGAQNRARSAYETGVAQAMADRVVRAQQDLANNPPVVPDVGAAAGVVDMSGAVNAPVANASAAAQRASAAAGLRRRRALRGARIGRI